MTEAEKAYQYFVIAVPENEEQAKAYFWARKVLQPTITLPNEWVSVEERLPEEKQRVIVRCERVGTSVGWILWGRWMTDIGPHAGDVTHWMPLPTPPDKDNHVPAKAPNEPLTCKGDENGEQRLIDANKILYHQAWESGSMEPANEGVALMGEVQAMPTIDPETIPIVRQLREELALITHQRDVYKSVFERITAHGDCNDCEDVKGCRFAPGIGEDTRYNCPLWRGPQKTVD